MASGSTRSTSFRSNRVCPMVDRRARRSESATSASPMAHVSTNSCRRCTSGRSPTIRGRLRSARPRTRRRKRHYCFAIPSAVSSTCSSSSSTSTSALKTESFHPATWHRGNWPMFSLAGRTRSGRADGTRCTWRTTTSRARYPVSGIRRATGMNRRPPWQPPISSSAAPPSSIRARRSACSAGILRPQPISAMSNPCRTWNA